MKPADGLAAALLFGGTLFSVLGFVNVYPFVFSHVTDHFQYLARLGPIAFLAAAATRYVLGSALLEAGRRVAAIAQFEETLRFNPNHAGAREGLDRIRSGGATARRRAEGNFT